VWDNIVAAGAQLIPSASAYPFTPDAPQARAFRSSRIWASGGSSYGTGAGKTYPTTDYYRMAQTPAYFVEGLGEVSSTSAVESHGGSGNTLNETLHYYRITGRSTGGTDGVVRAAESTFSVSVFEN
jgi:Type IV pilus assembly protein PilX C-term